MNDIRNRLSVRDLCWAIAYVALACAYARLAIKNRSRYDGAILHRRVNHSATHTNIGDGTLLISIPAAYQKRVCVRLVTRPQIGGKWSENHKPVILKPGDNTICTIKAHGKIMLAVNNELQSESQQGEFILLPWGSEAVVTGSWTNQITYQNIGDGSYLCVQALKKPD